MTILLEIHAFRGEQNRQSAFVTCGLPPPLFAFGSPIEPYVVMPTGSDSLLSMAFPLLTVGLLPRPPV